MKSDGANTPPDSADADGQAARDHLPGSQDDQEPQGVAAADSLVHDRVADPIQLRDRQQKQAQRDPADRLLRPLRAAAPDPVADVLGLIQDVLERQPDQRRGHREQGDEQVAARVLQHDTGRKAGEERRGAQELPADQVSDHRRQHHGEDRLDGELPQDQLDPEEHAGDRSVERGGNAAGRAARDQDAHPVFRHPDPLAEAGRERGADLHDRSFPAHRPAGADAQRGGNGLDRADLRPDSGRLPPRPRSSPRARRARGPPARTGRSAARRPGRR